MRRHRGPRGLAWLAALLVAGAARADGSGRELASYYDRHMALVDGAAYGWVGRAAPLRMRAGIVAVGVSREAYFALQEDGSLITWASANDPATTLMRGVSSLAVGQSGWFAIDRDDVLWHGGAGSPAPRRVAEAVIAASIGDGTDYYVTRDGVLHARGLAHRGQYGDGRLAATADFVPTARDAVAVKAHTGHAIHLRRDGVVLGTGGNRFGPLSSHGLGDKADRWGTVFDGARAIATGSRHSVAIRSDGTLWAWGGPFGIEPRRLMGDVVAAAAGDTATIVLTGDGVLWQFDDGGSPRRLALR